MAHDSVNVRTLAFGVGLALLGVFSLFIYKFSKKQEKEEKSGEEKDETQGVNNGEMQFRTLMNLLDSEDEKSILSALNKLGNLTAFKEFQVLVREYGGLAKIPLLTKSRSQDIKAQALNVINNLAMDLENQFILKELIPDVVGLLRHEQCSSAMVILAATRVLTNLTTLDENHSLLLPHLQVLLEMLRISELPVKLQVLKILVNISTNNNIVENELETDIQIIRAVSDVLGVTRDEEIVLRTVTCLANILAALRLRWQNKSKSRIRTAEFVSEEMVRNLEELQQHKNEDIVSHTGRALAALQLPAEDRANTSISNVDMIEILRL